MACVACKSKTKDGYGNLSALQNPPYGAKDIMVYQSGEVKKLSADDWDQKTHKLILFFPETNTPVCETELGALQKWIPEFEKINCEVIAATADPIHLVKDWFENDDSLRGSTYRVISSFILPSRLNLMHNGRAKRASVFITADADVVVQEHFMKVGRSLAELHRTMWAYTQDTYCGEGWQDPSDNLTVDHTHEDNEEG